MYDPDQRPVILPISRLNFSWRKAACCALLTAASIIATNTYAKEPEPPGLFSRLPGKSRERLPEQAFPGKSHTVKINRGQLRRGRLILRLPGGISIEAIRDLRQNMGNKRFSWVGHPADNKAGRVIFGVSGDAVAGTIAYKGKLFKLEPRANGSHVLSRVKKHAPAPELDPIPVADASSPDNFTSGTAIAADDAAPVIDVLVAYTPEVESRYGTQGAEALIIQAVAEANQAYANSGINPRLNLVSSVLTNYAESGDMTKDLSRLRATDDGYMDELHALRDSHGADLVSLIGHEPRYCGYAYRMDNLSAGFASSAFSVVHHGCATGYYSFAHELGHNQGAHHDPDNGTGAIYPYAHGYQDPFKTFRTVMALKCSGGCTRVDHFSNPNILYRGEPTGTVGAANNALTLNTTAATIADFRQQMEQALPAAPAELQAMAASDSEIDLNWLDNAADESGFTVERSENDRDFVRIASLAANTTRYPDNNLNADTLYYYRARSYNSAGNSGYSNTAIVATDPTPPPSKPSGLTATAGGTDSIWINWTDTSDNESGFSIQRRLDGSSQWVQLGTTGPNAATYADTGLQAGTRYYYRVAAYNDTGQSGNSNSDSAQTDEPPVSKYLRQQDLLH